MKQVIPLFIFFSLGLVSFGQEPPTIKVKKINSNVYFFPKNAPGDTIIKNKTDLFYLVVSDLIKSKTTIYVENGTFSRTDNDSIYKLNYISGISYECVFYKTTITNKKGEVKNGYEFKSQINGTSGQPKNQVLVYFKYESEVKPFIENRFYYKN